MQYPDALHVCIALGPLAVYLLLLGLINLGKHPFVTTGSRDAAALGVALSGFAVVGPMKLFMPQGAAEHFGIYVWFLLLAFYALCLSLAVLMMRPRLVIYNIHIDQLRPILANVVVALDPEVRWAGDSVSLPRLGVRFSIESQGSPWNTQLAAAGTQQNDPGWRRLEVVLAGALRETTTGRNLHGVILTLSGVVILGGITAWMLTSPAAIAQGLQDLLRP